MSIYSEKHLAWLMERDYVGNVQFERLDARVYQPHDHANSKANGEGGAPIAHTPIFHGEDD